MAKTIMPETKIFKYELEIVDEQFITMPAPLKILSAQVQNGVLCLWALVSEDAPKEKLPVRIVGTGNPIEDCLEWEFLSTAQMGRFVWHVFYQDPNHLSPAERFARKMKEDR